MAEECCGEKDTCCEPPPLRLPKLAEARDKEGVACCAKGMPVFDGLDSLYTRILWAVIAVNGAMFLTEMIGGHVARSQALQADALDFLADTATYGLSLSVIGCSLKTRASAALLKGLSLT